MNVEEIEPRILHSADLAPFVAPDVAAAQIEMRVVETPTIAPLPSTQQERRHEIVVVDSAVADYQQLVDDILAQADASRQVDVIVLRPGDGLMRITDALAGRNDIDALHIVSHGEDGAIFLGRDRLDMKAIAAREAELEQWGAALQPDADILIYGCDVARTDTGRAMLQRLAAVTGADVAASADATGAAQLGGDWDLEYRAGAIESSIALSASEQAAWQGVLGAAPVLSGANALTSINEDASPNTGTTVADLLLGHVTDADPGALQGIAVTAVGNTNGAWQYSIDSGSTWSNFGGVSVTNALLLDASNKVRFVPAADWSGTVTNGITFRAWDQTSGTAGGTANTDRVSPTPFAFDSFDTKTYTANEGNTPWAGNWTEIGDDNNPTNGQIEIPANNKLTLHGGQSGTASIYREINLAGASTASLSFNFSDGAGNATVSLKVSSNGGASYTTLAVDGGFGASPRTFDLAPYISANTRILFDVVGEPGIILGLAAGGDFTVDNFRVDWEHPLNGLATAFSTATASSGITVNPVNDAPAGADKAITILEDSPRVLSAADFGFSDPVESNALKAVKITTLPAAGSLTLNGAAMNAGDVVDAADIAANRLVYTPAVNANGAGYASFTFQVQDTGGTANGGVDLDASPNTITINVTAVNDAPIGADRTITAIEDTAYVFGAGDFGFSDVVDGNTLQAVKISTLPAAGGLKLGGAAVSAGQLISAANITGGLLTYTAAADANGAGYTSFTFQVQDDGGVANGGVDLDASANTITIDVTAVNDAPAGTPHTVSALEDTPYPFTTLDFGFSDTRDGNALAAVKISTSPSIGGLKLDGAAVSVGQIISATDIGNGKLTYVAPPDAWGTAYTSFAFQVQDDGGTANSGVNLDPTARLMTINVASVADAPTGTSKTIAAVEDTPYVFATGDFGFSDPADGGANVFTAVKIDTIAGGGALRLNGVAVTAGQTVTAVDIAANKLVFTPAANANGTGYASFTFQVQDNGTTTSGGVNLDPTARTMAINVAAVNDAPAGVSKTVTTLEDTAYTLAIGDFGFSDAVEGNALQAVKITTLPGAGALRLNGVAVTAGQSITAADIAANKLVFTPAANANGPGYASFTFQVQDSGGTASGGVDLDPVARTMTINVTAVQDAPTLNGANDLAAINEDATGSGGTLVSALLATHFSDVDAGAQSGIAVVGVDNTNGTWQYSINAGSSWSDFGAPSAGASRLLAADAKVRFVPDANWNGAVVNGLTFRAWDRTTGVNGGTAPTIANPTYKDNFSTQSYSNNDGTALFSGSWVDGDNDPGSGRIRIESGFLEIKTNGTGSVYRELDLSAASAAQLSFTFASSIASNDTSVVSIEISSNGGASYTTIGAFSATSLTGSGLAYGDISAYLSANTRIRFDVTTSESPPETIWIGTLTVAATTPASGGGTAFSTATATSGITVNAVNDAPAGANKTVTTLEDTPYVFNVAAFGLSDSTDAASNSGANALAAVKVSSLPAAGSLRLSGVAVTAGQFVSAADIAAGNLVFTPAANANGSSQASFTFQVQDDGGTASGGVNLDPTPATMTINVTAVNDAPSGTNKTVTVLEDGSYVFTTASFGFSDVNDSPANALRSVKVSALPTAGTLTLNGSAVTAGQLVSTSDIDAGKLVYRPAADANGAGYASFTFQVRDDGGTSNGGVDLDTVARTFTFNVTAVNDAPVGANKTVTTLEDTAHVFTAAEFGFGDPKDGGANSLAGVKIVARPTAGALALNGVVVTNGQVVSAVDIAAGRLVFIPGANANGAAYASFTFKVQDDGGTANGGVDLDATARTMRIDVTAVNDAPAGNDTSVGTLENTPFVFNTSAFGFTDVRDGNGLLAVRINTVPVAGTLTLSGVGVTAGQSVTAADIAAGKLVYAPGTNQSGLAYASLTFQVQDTGGTANGGIDMDPTANTLTIDVGAINHTPVGTDATLTLNEDTAVILGRASFGFSDTNDVLLNNFVAVRIAAVPAAGALRLNGVAVSAGQLITVADLDAGKLVYTPPADANGAAYAQLTFQVKDDGGTANGGVDLDPTPNTLTFDVTAVNDAPTGADATVATNEDVPYVFDLAAFGYADATDGGANNLFAVRIDVLPAAGALTLNGVGIVAGQSIAAADIAAGNLAYTPAANANGAGYASFRFRVQDDGGTAGGGVDLDAIARTMTIGVAAINDAPTGASRTVTAYEDTPYVFDASVFGFRDDIDGGANALAAVKIVSLPVTGALTLNGVAVTGDQLVAASDIAAGRLVYTSLADQNGAAYASFAFQVQDDGGTANGGINLDATARTLNVDVAAVNDAPGGANATVTLLEDTPTVLTTALFGFSDAIDGNSLAAVKITTLTTAGSLALNGAAVSAGQLVSAADIAAGKLVYTPGANGNGVGYASFTFQVRDDGGTAGGGVDLDPTPRTLTFDVTAVSDAPTGSNATVTATEDATYVFTTSVFGFGDAADAGAHGLSAVKIATLPVAGSLTLGGVAVTAGQWIDAIDIAAGGLVFTPVADANGAAYASFTFQVKDDGGVANGGVDVDATPRMLTIDVAAVNDAPSGASATVTINEDATLRLNASAFGFTDAVDRGANALKAVTITSLPAAGTLTLDGVAVTAGQSIAAADLAAGKLVFKPATDASGAAYASIDFRVQDDGGGADTDPVARTLSINVLAGNDAPTGVSGTVATAEDTPLMFTTAAFGFSDAVEGNAFLAVKISTLPTAGTLALNGVAVSAGQFVSAADIAAGKLVFTPAANANGAAYASFAFQLQDDGGTANGGADLDAIARTLTVDVASVNDAPSGRNALATLPQDGSYTLAAASFGFSDASDSPANAFAGVNVVTLPGAGALRLAGVAVSAGQFVTVADLAASRLVFAPTTGGAGDAYASFTFKVQDDGSTGSGASNVDALARTFTFNVTPKPAPAVQAPVVTVTLPTQVVAEPTVQTIGPAPSTTTGSSTTTSSEKTSTSTSTSAATTQSASKNVEQGAAQRAAAEAAASGGGTSGGGSGAAAAAAAQLALGATEVRPIENTVQGAAGVQRLESQVRSETRNALGPVFNVVADAPLLLAQIQQGDGLSDLNRAFGMLQSGSSSAAANAAAAEQRHLMQQLDEVRDTLREQTKLEASTVAASASAAVSLSVGYVVWLLRGGVLVSTFLSSLPAWRLVDPLPILDHIDDEEGEDDDSLESLVARNNLAAAENERSAETSALQVEAV